MLKNWIKYPTTTAGRLAKFVLRMLSHFFGRNNGLLLSGAVAYNTLLSVVPLFAVILVISSHFFDEQQILVTISAELQLLVPGQASALTDALKAFLSERELIGGIGFLVLLFFSTIAFRILENAMAVIFGRPVPSDERRFWVSVLIPYVFITLLGIGLVLVTGMTAALDALPAEAVNILGYELSLDRASSIALYISGVVGMVLLLTALYTVLPVTKIQFRRALIGGITATVLWEIVRHFLMWYFTSISLVNVVYGSFATVVIVLLGLEVAAVILLLGAQVIAELERNAHAGIPWHVDIEEELPLRVAKGRDRPQTPSRKSEPGDASSGPSPEPQAGPQ